MANTESHAPGEPVKLKPFSMTQREFMALAWWFRRKKNFVPIILFGLAFVAIMNAAFPGAYELPWTYAAALVVAIVLVYGGQIFAVLRAAFAAENRSAFKEIQVEFDHVELRTTRARGNKVCVPFSLVVKVREPGPFYLLYISRGEAALVPKRAFQSRDDEARFREILAEHDLLKAG